MRTQYLLTHPDARKRSQVRECDEREQAIVARSFQCAGFITFFASAAALLVLLPLSRGGFYALLGAMALYAVTFCAANLYLSKKL